ncbi:unnamed protein product [Plutella xylostella]|uniref:(diamondback moth) hypothetical protein n=1 Tax=Plutella xylostella TaxID=51655 RepID=A0A8S4E4A3_PLUXY|nr:unnamed protein product [Plutella xylostella]
MSDQLNEFSTKIIAKMQCLLEENMLQLKNVVLSEIKAIIKTFTQDLEELKHSFTFMSQEYEDLKKEVNAQKLTISTITKENLELQRTLLEHSHKINSFEQSLKSCNVEIQGVPEKRNENPQTIVKKLCETISEPMSDDDIVACRRVAKLNPSSRHIYARLSIENASFLLFCVIIKVTQTTSYTQNYLMLMAILYRFL